MMGMGVHKHHLVLKTDLEAGTMCKNTPLFVWSLTKQEQKKLLGLNLITVSNLYNDFWQTHQNGMQMRSRLLTL
jgi:hypothetical protein